MVGGMPSGVPIHGLEMEIGGRSLRLETGRLAKQANGAVLVRYADTVVLVTATASASPREGVDFFPLTVDYEERSYAVGKIPGGFIKREGRPSEKATLAARLTDRPLRPLFPQGFRNDVQVIATVLSMDHDAPPEVLSIIGASAALSISDIPFGGPVGAVVVGLIEDRFVLNPTGAEEAASRLHLAVAGTRDAVIMIEAGAHEVPESVILEAIAFGHHHIRSLVELQERLVAIAGKPKRDVPLFQLPEALVAAAREAVGQRLAEAVMTADKKEREVRVSGVSAEARTALLSLFPDGEREIDLVLKKLLKEEVRSAILHRGIRPDGRGLTDIRPLRSEAGLLPRVHGSGLFTRGQTQVLSVCTLGAVSDVQVLDGLGFEEFKRYLHHYNFPPFSTGEAKPLRAPSRRSIGHGALAERALRPVIPPEESFPYTIRVVSEVLESNGSSSMASVCGSTLSLMDAGVPLKAPVGGIAMGLVKEGDRVAILTDIQGMEDALGDMDFKVAGTRDGVTAIQMDIKIGGLSEQILEGALEQARLARLAILDHMATVLPAPRSQLSPYAPRILVTHIDPEKIRDVIGPGGKTINRIIEETRSGEKKVDIDIQDDGTIHVTSLVAEAGEHALRLIHDLVRDVLPGEIYHGRVTRIAPFGAFVEILPGREGLVHISQLADDRVEKVEDVVRVGEQIPVKVLDLERGRINLSYREALREISARNRNGSTSFES